MICFCDNLPSVKTWTAKRIRELREAAGMTQAQLAHWLGVTRVHVTHLETDFRSAGPQSVRLLNVLAKLRSGELRDRRAVQPKKRRTKK